MCVEPSTQSTMPKPVNPNPDRASRSSATATAPADPKIHSWGQKNARRARSWSNAKAGERRRSPRRRRRPQAQLHSRAQSSARIAWLKQFQEKGERRSPLAASRAQLYAVPEIPRLYPYLDYAVAQPMCRDALIHIGSLSQSATSPLEFRSVQSPYVCPYLSTSLARVTVC